MRFLKSIGRITINDGAFPNALVSQKHDSQLNAVPIRIWRSYTHKIIVNIKSSALYSETYNHKPNIYYSLFLSSLFNSGWHRLIYLSLWNSFIHYKHIWIRLSLPALIASYTSRGRLFIRNIINLNIIDTMLKENS